MIKAVLFGLVGGLTAVVVMLALFPLVWGVMRCVSGPPGEKLEALWAGVCWFVLVVAGLGLIAVKALG